MTFVEKPAEKEYGYTIAVIPDTQILTGGYTDFSVYTALTEYLKSNREKQKIAFALHVGDLCNDAVESQFAKAKQAMDILDGFLPYVVVPGNHDYDWNSKLKRDTSVYNKYFPFEKFSNAEGFGGAYEDGKTDNTYWTFRAGEESFLVVALEFGLRDSVLEWANEIVEQNGDKKVIVVTHTDVHYDGEMITDTSENAPGNYLNGGYLDIEGDPANNGDDVWNKFASLHENIIMIVLGHIKTDNIVTRTDTDVHGNRVLRMLINAQGLDFDMWLDREKFGADGLGMVCLLRFSENANRVDVEFYSPYLDKYLNSENQFTYVWNKSGESDSTEDGTVTQKENSGRVRQSKNLLWFLALVPVLAVAGAVPMIILKKK